MIDTRVNIDMDNILPDTKQLFFNNLQLLGFDVLAMEATNHIPFNKAMFELPNKRGAELVLHYLFQRLNPTMCREAFRDCWPIIDKKREQGFRKTCSNWLTNISQEEPNSHLPRINASLFMSPGGDKFYQLLFYFSGYILQRVIGTELGSKMSERLKYPLLTSQNLQQGDVMVKALTCSSIRCRTSYFSNVQTHVNASKSWKDTADEYVREYRKMNKEIRELDYTVRGEEQKSVAASVARGSPAKRRSGQADHFDPEFDPRTIKRAQRVQQVRDMWKQLEDFDQTEAAEREVVESIVERTINKYRLDAADISVKVPDMLLRECGNEIRRRNVDNTYQGGRLNLVSVLQLWNLSLHLYLEKINQVGVPTFEEEVRELTSQVHVQQNYAQNAQTLREQMSVRVPVLKSSIEKLREKLDSALFQDQTPDTIRTTVSSSDNIPQEIVMGNTAASKLVPLSIQIPQSDSVTSKDVNTVCRKMRKIEIRRPVRQPSSHMKSSKTCEGNEHLKHERDSNSEERGRKVDEVLSTNCQVIVSDIAKKSCKRIEASSTNCNGKYKDRKRECGSKNMLSHPYKETIELGHVDVVRGHKSMYSEPICFECGAECVCGQTAVAGVSPCPSPYTSVVIDVKDCIHSGLNSANEEMFQNNVADFRVRLSDLIEKPRFHKTSPVCTPRHLEAGRQKVTRAKIQDFEDMLKTHNLHPESVNLDLCDGLMTDTSMNPVTDLSVTTQSGSSGYVSYKHETSSLPDDSFLRTDNEHSYMSCSTSGTVGGFCGVVRSISRNRTNKEKADQKQYIGFTLPHSNMSQLCSPINVKSVDEIFQPLKDMLIKEINPFAGVLNVPKGQQRKTSSLREHSPLKDMSVFDYDNVSFDDFTTTEHNLSSTTGQLKLTSSCKKYSPLKDMSFSDESRDENKSQNDIGNRNGQSKVCKYIEMKGQGESDDIITLVSNTCKEGNQSSVTIRTEYDDLQNITVNQRMNVSGAISGNKMESKHVSEDSGIDARYRGGSLIHRSDRMPSDVSGILPTNTYSDENTSVRLHRSWSRSDCGHMIVNDSVFSVKHEENVGCKFYRSPKGSLKRVRFCFPAE